MRRFQVISCFLADHPQFVEARSLDLLEDRIQAWADDRLTRAGDRYGELTFKYFNKFGYKEVHAFFINRHGTKRRFLKATEVQCHANDK